MSDAKFTARRALGCLDLTNLDADCDAAAIADLCARARTPHGNVAAVCIWPQFVAQAQQTLHGTGIRVATVVNFPGGDDDLDEVTALTRDALGDGADEIDMVIPWRELAAGRLDACRHAIRRVREASEGATLKAILESGLLAEPHLIGLAADIALEAGADFLKTSTGKVPVNATPEAVEIMLTKIRDLNRPCGIKPSGGVRTLDDAALYLGLADRIMGPGWVQPNTFRFGASSLLAALLATLDGNTVAPVAGAAY